MNLIDKWVRKEFLDDKKIVSLKKQFLNAKNFEHLSIDGLFIDEKINELFDELEKLDYYKESSDLYEFFRTVDFKNINNKKILQFRNLLLSKDFTNFISKVCDLNISKDNIDIHSLKLMKTNYLLCHDDRVDTRKIAFVLNFSDFDDGDGGSLDLFDVKEDKANKIFESVVPKFNRFNLFKVSNKSFHQISEVETSKTRITIGGWFY